MDHYMRSLIVGMLALALPALAQHDQSNNEKKNPAIGNPDAIAKGAKLYAGSCAGCHGPDGSGGRGPNLVRRASWHPLTDDGTFDVIRNGVPGADMPPTKLPDDQTWNLVAFVRAFTAPAVEARVDGDAAGGEQLFWGAKAGCSNCHAIRGKGSRTGPDLSNIGGTQPLPLIRESILQPSKDPAYYGKEAVTLTMKSGAVIKGIARNRSNYSVQLIDTKGDLHLISMADVKDVTVREQSSMPGDYGKRLTPTELRDLLAYLAQQSVRKPETESTKR